MKPRLLPIAVFAAAAVLAVKAMEFWQGVDTAFGRRAYAQAAATAKPGAQPAAGGDQAAPANAPENASSNTPSAAAGQGQGGDEQGAPDRSAGTPALSAVDPILMTQSEIELLKKLSQRRGELETWSNDLSLREQLLKAAELRIESKLGELKQLQETIKASLKTHDDEQEAKLKSLVKIYETMKPKEAARIFEQLEMPVLLDVIERMKEAKVAPVLAAMDPEKAKRVTTDLAKRRRLVGEGARGGAEQASSAN